MKATHAYSYRVAPLSLNALTHIRELRIYGTKNDKMGAQSSEFQADGRLNLMRSTGLPKALTPRGIKA